VDGTAAVGSIRNWAFVGYITNYYLAKCSNCSLRKHICKQHEPFART